MNPYIFEIPLLEHRHKIIYTSGGYKPNLRGYATGASTFMRWILHAIYIYIDRYIYGVKNSQNIGNTTKHLSVPAGIYDPFILSTGYYIQLRTRIILYRLHVWIAHIKHVRMHACMYTYTYSSYIPSVMALDGFNWLRKPYWSDIHLTLFAGVIASHLKLVDKAITKTVQCGLPSQL